MRNFTDLERLDLLFRYIKENRDTLLDSDSKNIKLYKIFTYLVNLCEANKFPQVIEDEKFDAIKSVVLFRGASDIEHHANLLCDYDYHYGYGMYGSGIHLTTTRVMAALYTKTNLNNVLTAKFLGKAIGGRRVSMYIDYLKKLMYCNAYDLEIDYKEDEQKLKMFAEYYNKLKTDEDKKLFEDVILSNDYSIISLLLDYDAMHNYTWLTVFNREKLAVSESEFERITNASKNYKGGVINFDAKSENDFLME